MNGSLFKRFFRKTSIVHSIAGNFEILVSHLGEGKISLADALESQPGKFVSEILEPFR